MPPSVCLVKHRFAHAPHHSHVDLGRIWDQPILPVPVGVADPLHWRVTALNGASLPLGAWSPHGPPPAHLQGWALFKILNIFKSRYNSYNIKYAIVKCTIQWFFLYSSCCATISILCGQIIPITPKRSPSSHFQFPLFQSLVTTILLSISVDLSVLDIYNNERVIC